MDARVPIWSTSWSGYHDDGLEDYSNGPLAITLRQSVSPTNGHHYFSAESPRTFIRPLLETEEGELLHPQPGLVSRATFMPDYPGWRRSSVLSHGHGSVGSSTISSNLSERHLSPPFSPDIIHRTHTRPSSVLPDDVSYTHGGFSPRSRHDSHASMACVAMNEVQNLADEPPEVPAVVFSNESHTWLPGTYGTYIADDGYQPMDQDPDEHTPGTYLSTPNSSEYHTQATSRHESEEQDQEPVQIRRRRAPSTTTLTSPQPSTARVRKRPQHTRHNSSYRSIKSEDSSETTAPTKKVFPCSFAVYGCTASFGNKNEWKRHVHTQHLRLAYWRCEQCAEVDNGRKPNDFNRRDLFIQHVRRMHPFTTDGPSQSAKGRSRSLDEDQYLAAEGSRCHRQLRQAPQSSRCLLCDQHFRGENSWDQRMEHVGRHFEDSKRSSGTAAQDPQQWNVDRDLERYLIEEEILVGTGQGLRLPECR